MAQHWCKEHKTLFFKKGKMKVFAHPIKDENGEDTGQWCNEPTEKPTDGQEKSPQEEMTKEDWDERDRIKTKSIERQKSIECAVMLCQSAQIKSDEILAYAKKFEVYLEGSELKTTSPSQGKGDRVVKQSPKEDLSWETVCKQTNKLILAKKEGWKSKDDVLNTFARLNADVTSGNPKISYEILDDAGKREFIRQVEEALEEP